MGNIGDRVRKKRIALGLSQADLAKKIGGIRTSAIGNIESRGAGGSRFINKLADVLGVSIDWLQTGEEGTSHHSVFETTAEYVAPPQVSIPAGASVRAYEDPSELDPDSYVWVKRYDVNLSAGYGNIQWVVQKEDPLAFRMKWFQYRGHKPENCKALYVRGRSMEPHLNDMDTVLVDTSQTTVVDGEIYALCYMDEFYIKTVLKIPGGYRLKSENPTFDSFDVLGENLNQLHIIGQKVWRAG